MAKAAVKKKPSDYGLYSFRVNETERAELDALLSKAKDRINKSKAPDEYVMTKNQIILAAIRLGVGKVKRT